MHPRVINYRSYRDFSNETFRVSLINNLSNEVFVNNDDGLQKLCKTTMDTLNSFAPIKKNWYELLWKFKWEGITDNKKFWKTVKPFLFDKSINSGKIHLNENEELINSKSKIAEVLNEFFSNTVKNIKITEHENLNRNFEKVKYPVLKAILKYKNHPSITAIKEKSKNSKFTFHEVDNEKIIKEIKRLDKNKDSQKSNIPITIIHENADIFADFLAVSLKGAIKT